MKNLETRIIALFAIAAALLYGYTLVHSYNPVYPWYSLAFISFDLLMILGFTLFIINNWSWKEPESLIVTAQEPIVAVIIPTWSEAPTMVENTIRSVITQDYPHSRLIIVVSDDAHNPEVKDMVNALHSEYPAVGLLYHEPPAKDDPAREGEGKAGNLNSALRILARYPEIEYIETRDADDEVGSKTFLREVIAQMAVDDKVGFVQTIKQVKHAPGDPFGNQEEFFYNSLMLSKYAANSVFPCGSGVVWRKTALLDIGGFPTWNLVEDFQSGAEALRRGWKSVYLPIIGAQGQIAPEDIPNLFKQRGTWALDSLRFFFWGNKKGLNLRQRLHFSEAGFFYIVSALSYVYAFLPGIFLLKEINPLTGDLLTFALAHAAYVGIMYLFKFSLVRRKPISVKSLMRNLQIFFGLGPVYGKQVIKALWYNGGYKPAYKVTRKNHLFGMYIPMVLPQLLLVGFLGYAVVQHFMSITSYWEIDWINVLWISFFVYMYERIIRNSWFKFNPWMAFTGLFAGIWNVETVAEAPQKPWIKAELTKN